MCKDCGADVFVRVQGPNAAKPWPPICEDCYKQAVARIVAALHDIHRQGGDYQRVVGMVVALHDRFGPDAVR